MGEVNRLFNERGVEDHICAENMQLYAGNKPSRVEDVRLNRCTGHITSWYEFLRLQFDVKSGIACFGSGPSLAVSQPESLRLESVLMSSKRIVLGLGIRLYPELSLRYHIAKVAA